MVAAATLCNRIRSAFSLYILSSSEAVRFSTGKGPLTHPEIAGDDDEAGGRTPVRGSRAGREFHLELGPGGTCLLAENTPVIWSFSS